MKIEEVKVRKDNVLISVIEDQGVQDGIYTGVEKKNLRTEVELYFGKVEKLDFAEARLERSGEIVIFNRLAGFPAKTEEAYCKVIPFDQILAYMSVDKKITPSAKRVLVRTKKFTNIDDEGIINMDNADPREQDIATGVVVNKGSEVKNLPANATAYFDPWCGTVVTDVEGGEVLMLIYEHDILYFTE